MEGHGVPRGVIRCNEVVVSAMDCHERPRVALRCDDLRFHTVSESAKNSHEL